MTISVIKTAINTGSVKTLRWPGRGYRSLMFEKCLAELNVEKTKRNLCSVKGEVTPLDS